MAARTYAHYAGGLPGGIGNPLGARALYLYRGNQDTYFRLHGTNEPETIGEKVSSGCIRLFNHDIIDLYDCRSALRYSSCRRRANRSAPTPKRMILTGRPPQNLPGPASSQIGGNDGRRVASTPCCAGQGTTGLVFLRRLMRSAALMMLSVFGAALAFLIKSSRAADGRY